MNHKHHNYAHGEKRMLTAFLLNLFFCIFEFLGGLFSGSVAILSDALHDLGDAASIGVSYFCQKKSQKKADSVYTYGYARYSLLGGTFTTVILILGSLFMLYHSVQRLFSPTEIHSARMIGIAVLGFVTNLIAARLTHGGDSLNEKAVTLHLLEDVLGWAVVLVGAVVMHFTSFYLLDPLLSICMSVFILIHAIKTLKQMLNIFLERAPEEVDTEELKKKLCALDGVKNVHHLHFWALDERRRFATLHLVCEGNCNEAKARVREILHDFGVVCATIETDENECTCATCR